MTGDKNNQTTAANTAKTVSSTKDQKPNPRKENDPKNETKWKTVSNKKTNKRSSPKKTMIKPTITKPKAPPRTILSNRSKQRNHPKPMNCTNPRNTRKL